MTALLLGLVMTFWQMGHFYSIAIFRHKDYAAGKIPVWSVRYGIKSTQKWLLFYVVLFVLAILSLALQMSSGWVLGVLIGLMGVYWLYRGFAGFKALESEKWARGMFGLSLVVLLAFSGVIALTPLLYR